jgi:murein DD-endopeptidase MepM/ murein hydrolase activator NlpD
MTKLFPDYQPEQHYMRGPGPKWLAKHGEGDRAPAHALCIEAVRGPGSAREPSSGTMDLSFTRAMRVLWQARDAALALTSSCWRWREIAVAIVAVAVAGCSANMARFDGDPFARQLQRDMSTASLSASEPGPELRPKADLVADVRHTKAGQDHTPVRVAALGDVPVRMPPQEAAPLSAARRPDAPSRKEAKLKRKSLGATGQQSMGRPAHKPAARRPIEARAVAASAIFEWPVHGPIVARFGTQRDGQHNSGIAIEVAENTPIRSAENGVVIYAGSGLKSFGNLALVRHAGNYVTAYGHAKELAVKRGDQLKRGEIIGRSGQTGQASTPRVHFEIRKDSVAVDPVPLLKRSSTSR